MMRYGAADELRDRLRGDNVRQALAAWQALGTMVHDDSRKVVDAAEGALAAAELRLSPPMLDLIATHGKAEGELLLEGPPIALCAIATTAEPWLYVEQEGSHVQVTADLGDVERRDGLILLSGPITERLEVPVVVRTTKATEEAESKPAKTMSMPTSGTAGSAAPVIERAEVREERAAATEHSLWDGPRLGPRGLRS